MTLDTLTSALFAAHKGKTLTIEAFEAELVLDVINITEAPQAAAPDSRRTPFKVLLRGPDSPCLSDGCYTLRAEGNEAWRLEGIYLNRVIPPAGTDGRGAFYQVIFG